MGRARALALVLLAVAEMALAQSLRDELLDRLADELAALVAEEFLDLAVEADDQPGGIDDEKAVRRRVDEDAQRQVCLGDGQTVLLKQAFLGQLTQ